MAAAAADPRWVLGLDVWCEGVRSVPQLLLDVVYSDSGGRLSPNEARHLLCSRPPIAEADQQVAEAVQVGAGVGASRWAGARGSHCVAGWRSVP